MATKTVLPRTNPPQINNLSTITAIKESIMPFASMVSRNSVISRKSLKTKMFYTKTPCHNWYTPNPASASTENPNMAFRTWFPKRAAWPKSKTIDKFNPIIAK